MLGDNPRYFWGFRISETSARGVEAIRMGIRLAYSFIYRSCGTSLVLHIPFVLFDLLTIAGSYLSPNFVKFQLFEIEKPIFIQRFSSKINSLTCPVIKTV
jgi:hypothetical protein